MITEWIIGFMALAIAYFIILTWTISTWELSDHKRDSEIQKLSSYLEKLGSSVQVHELLQQFGSLRELKRANNRLKKCVKE